MVIIVAVKELDFGKGYPVRECLLACTAFDLEDYCFSLVAIYHMDLIQ